MRHIYAKLGVHRRTEAVRRARELGLLAPSARRQRTAHTIGTMRAHPLDRDAHAMDEAAGPVRYELRVRGC